MNKEITVIGAGTMGNGIAQVFASNKYLVQLVDQNEEILNKAISNIKSSLDKFVKKGTISIEQKESILCNIKTSTIENMEYRSELYIEAIIEDYSIKALLLKELNKNINFDSIIASNTSSISITKLAQNLSYKENFIGMHFMNPVPIMPLIEIIRGFNTSDKTFNRVKDITLELQKQPIEVSDFPGFISNRILMPMINEAIFALHEGVARKEEIDMVMKLGMNHPMGPLALADFIGLDVCLNIMNVLYEGFKDSKYRACPLLVKLVESGKLGKKTKEGFYNY